MVHQAFDSSFHALIDETAPVSQIGSGFEFTEGPIWNPVEKFLFFSDMPGDVRRGWDPAGGVQEIARPSNKGNGMTYDANLNLLVCEHATSSVVRITPDGKTEVLASHFEGKELNSPNDIVVKSDGSIWFTDPTYGRMPGFGVEREVELGFQGVYRIRPGGGGPELMVNRYTFVQPNGLCFCPDESKLYVNDTDQTNIRVFDVGPGGQLTNERIFASSIVDPEIDGVPDGMKCDAMGNVWVTAPGGLWVYAPSGYLIGKVAVPELVANFHWGGDDWRTLFVCASTSLYSIPVKVGSRREPFMAAVSDGRPQKIEKNDGLSIDPARCALIIQDMQNDVVMEGGAFAESGAPLHCAEQNNIENIAELAAICRQRGIPVIHVWFQVEEGCPELTMNAPLFEGVRETGGLVKGTWGAQSVERLAPQRGDYTVVKSRMSPWETTNLETILKARNVDTIINTGAWTNMAVEHTARVAADRGYRVVSPEDACSTMNAEWHQAAMNYALQNVSTVTDTHSVLNALRGA